jgi:pimeloyl-ACP methyl ester carboxylesterase
VIVAPWSATLQSKRAVASDGTGIAYEVLGKGDRTLLLANGLGGRLYAWKPLLDEFWRGYRIITWDYRGLFASESPQVHRHLSVAHQADDARVLLDAENVDRAVLVGWSMGVQVSLELAATYPNRIAGLVLLNGTYGHVLATGFQPLVSIPFLPKRLHAIVEWFRDHRELADQLARVTRFIELPTMALLALTTGTRARELTPMLRRYLDDVLGPSFVNFLRLFQELDAHSVYHLLPEIDAPTLVFSGLLDPLTPAYQSREIARRMPNAEHVPLFRSGHFSLLERPETVLPAMTRFFDHRARWQAR